MIYCDGRDKATQPTSTERLERLMIVMVVDTPNNPMKNYIICYRKTYTGGEMVEFKKILKRSGATRVEIRPTFISFYAPNDANFVLLTGIAKTMNSMLEVVNG